MRAEVLKNTFDGFQEGLRKVTLELVQAIFKSELESLKKTLTGQNKVVDRLSEEITKKVAKKVTEAAQPPEPAEKKLSLLERRQLGDIWRRTDSRYDYFIYDIKDNMTLMEKVGFESRIWVSEVTLKSRWRPVDKSGKTDAD